MRRVFLSPFAIHDVDYYALRIVNDESCSPSHYSLFRLALSVRLTPYSHRSAEGGGTFLFVPHLSEAVCRSYTITAAGCPAAAF